MPFIKKNIDLSDFTDFIKNQAPQNNVQSNLNNLNNQNIYILKNNLKPFIEQHQLLIELAEKRAKKIIADADLYAKKIRAKAQKESDEKQSLLKINMQSLITSTKEQTKELKQNASLEAKQEVFEQAIELLASLNDAKQAYFNQNTDFFKKNLLSLINILTSKIDAKNRLELLADHVLEKAKGLEDAILYFHSSDFENLPEIDLPLGWKILASNEVKVNSCKLFAQGSEWIADFDSLEDLLKKPFEPKQDFKI